MVKRILKALSKPAYSVRFLRNEIRKKFLLKKIEKGGQVFFQYKGNLYPEYLFKKKAQEHIKDKALFYCKGRGIDVGAGVWPLDGALPIENIPEENAYKLDNFADNSLDFVFSSHCLEHLTKWQKALSLWIRKIKKGGILFLYMPHKSMQLWKPGEIYGMGHAWSPSWEVLIPYLEKNGMEILEYEKSRDNYWSFHIVARKK